MDVTALLSARKEPVMKRVFELIEDGEPKLLYEMMRDYPSRSGKGLRPALVLITAEAFGAPAGKAITTAAALEMFQNWVLIHDDIEDGSDDRRGKPCLHKLHGVPLAINAGDALHIKMWEGLLKTRKEIGAAKSYKVMAKMAEMLDRTVEGQTMEISWVENKQWDVTEEDYYMMVHKKTAWYTVIAPMQMGAIIAGHGSQKAIHRFGEVLGRAFQIQDDVLNLVAEEDKYGKEIAGDIYEGKRTLMLLHLIRKCAPAEREKVLNIMNKPREQKTKEEVAHILQMMKDKGSIDYAKQKAKAFAAKAKKMFPKLRVPAGSARDELAAIIDFIVEREL
jgi:geranylgeranyl diphosphate synthase type II